MTPEQFYEAYGPIRENEPPPKDLVKYPNAFHSGKGLMQYNWVQRCDTKEPYQLMQILHSGVRFTKHVFGGHNTLFLYNEIEPIDLTPEILEKCGWKMYGQTRANRELWKFKFPFINERGLDLRKFIFEEENIIHDGYYSTCIVNLNHTEDIFSIKYLHQLQNLFFSLTGEELEYKP